MIKVRFRVRTKVGISGGVGGRIKVKNKKVNNEGKKSKRMRVKMQETKN